MSSIFVNIAGYHDYEIVKTIQNLIDESSKEHSINFGIHSVFEEQDNIGIFKASNIKCIASKAPSNLGPALGRYMAHSLYDNEDYYLMIDSHTRLSKDWDKIFIDDINYYKKLGFEKPLLTAYPTTYWYEDGVEKRSPGSHLPQNIRFTSYENNSLKSIVLGGSRHAVYDNSIYQHSIAGGFCFGPGPFINFNEDISFSEEFIVGAMLYTNGYDLLIPRSLIVYHYYNAPEKAGFEEFNRRSVWHYPPNLENLGILLGKSNETILNMIKENVVGKYCLGNKRSLEDYGKYLGISFDSEYLK
jgi:hypothetical protein